MTDETRPDPADTLRALTDDELRDTAARITAERLLPHLLALPDDALRDVLCATLAERAPYDHSPSREARLFLAVTGPAPRKKQGWRHRAVAIALPRLDDRRQGHLAFEGRCAGCATPLRADTAVAACPVCGVRQDRLGG
ncbi:hypothetical protein Sru01_23480 [Sphaerisporangium rufum]|uniref:Uncharacterized protein n=1 Tax=Sphaerisporangium rufum TaxID=1381558 RepID=A0A919UXU7_9ACTN|nr:hypothetical protein [Sphaerisporangium rufum]GII77366.1 hypothetical protein Sru01_23480 [Sphaerisporangium rufum]